MLRCIYKWKPFSLRCTMRVRMWHDCTLSQVLILVTLTNIFIFWGHWQRLDIFSCDSKRIIWERWTHVFFFFRTLSTWCPPLCPRVFWQVIKTLRHIIHSSFNSKFQKSISVSPTYGPSLPSWLPNQMIDIWISMSIIYIYISIPRWLEKYSTAICCYLSCSSWFAIYSVSDLLSTRALANWQVLNSSPICLNIVNRIIIFIT